MDDVEILKFTRGNRYDTELQLAFFTRLSGELQKLNFINKHSDLEFAILFSGKGFKDTTAIKFNAKWLREENLLIYMIDLLVLGGIITNYSLNSLIEKHFKIKDVATQRYNYKPNLKPDNYKEIDSIVEQLILELSVDEDLHRTLMTTIIKKANNNIRSKK